jgi:type IV pilus assembly protein PilV
VSLNRSDIHGVGNGRASKLRASETGFSLIEVLVAILIVSFGILGLAGLLFAAMNAGQVSMNRSTAVTLANEMADRIRANWRGVKDGAYDSVGTALYGDAAACNTACMTAQCSPSDQATLDICLWKKQVSKQLPGGGGAIDVDAANLRCQTPSVPCIFSVTVSWVEANYKLGTNPNLNLLDAKTRSYVVRVQP